MGPPGSSKATLGPRSPPGRQHPGTRLQAGLPGEATSGCRAGRLCPLSHGVRSSGGQELNPKSGDQRIPPWTDAAAPRRAPVGDRCGPPGTPAWPLPSHPDVSHRTTQRASLARLVESMFQTPKDRHTREEQTHRTGSAEDRAWSRIHTGHQARRQMFNSLFAGIARISGVCRLQRSQRGGLETRVEPGRAHSRPPQLGQVTRAVTATSSQTGREPPPLGTGGACGPQGHAAGPRGDRGKSGRAAQGYTGPSGPKAGGRGDSGVGPAAESIQEAHRAAAAVTRRKEKEGDCQGNGGRTCWKALEAARARLCPESGTRRGGRAAGLPGSSSSLRRAHAPLGDHDEIFL